MGRKVGTRVDCKAFALRGIVKEKSRKGNEEVEILKETFDIYIDYSNYICYYILSIHPHDG